MNDEKFRVVYTIFEYDPLLDSTNMTMDDWIHVARDIKVCTLYIHTFSVELIYALCTYTMNSVNN